MTSTTQFAPLTAEARQLLATLGVPAHCLAGGALPARTPITGDLLAHLHATTPAEADAAIDRAHTAFLAWRLVPAPRRGELVRLLGEELRAHRDTLGQLVTLEAGKILSEGRGEVQEMVDICVFAAGLSRQIGGLTLPSERPSHRMLETWHPLGVTGVISAFNFPVAVWAWNAALALVCGNPVAWKPSEKTPLTALAVQALFERAAAKLPDLPPNLSTLLLGNRDLGELLVDHPRIALVSATGSTAMGRAVGPKLAARFARSILELGGNNAAVITPTADLHLALRGIAFSAIGTAGQRCTTLRRLLVHTSVYDHLIPQLKRVYSSVTIGDPRDPSTLVGPLIDRQSFEAMQSTLTRVRNAGATVHGGDRVHPFGDPDANPEAFYVRPALVEVPTEATAASVATQAATQAATEAATQAATTHSPLMEQVRRETFAPILYLLRYRDLAEAIALHNDVPQGLSSAIFTNDLREAELFLSASGSDCGIANVNIGTSGAEIGGAFGGEKETGGGRESGSDAWKTYMRRSTNTINYGTDLPLAQGVSFDID